jgi:hypothetical protein
VVYQLLNYSDTFLFFIFVLIYGFSNIDFIPFKYFPFIIQPAATIHSAAVTDQARISLQAGCATVVMTAWIAQTKTVVAKTR